MTASAKIKAMEQAERALRKRLSQAERELLSRIVSEVIDNLEIQGGKITRSQANHILTERITRIFEAFQRSHLLPFTAEIAKGFLKIPSLNSAYYSTQGSSRSFRAMIRRITSASNAYIRAQIGLSQNGNLKPGGYLQSLFEDSMVRTEVRRILSTAIDGQQDFQGLKRQLRNYLTGQPITDEPVKQGALTRRFDQMAFDLLQEADRAVNLKFADELGLVFAAFQGGVIERTRMWCCERNNRYYTREEIEAMDAKDWAGKKGHPEIYGGGWNCRHQWMFVATSLGLKERPDIKEILHKKPGKKGHYTYQHTLGVGKPPLNDDCEELLELRKKQNRR